MVYIYEKNNIFGVEVKNGASTLANPRWPPKKWRKNEICYYSATRCAINMVLVSKYMFLRSSISLKHITGTLVTVYPVKSKMAAKRMTKSWNLLLFSYQMSYKHDFGIKIYVFMVKGVNKNALCEHLIRISS